MKFVTLASDGIPLYPSQEVHATFPHKLPTWFLPVDGAARATSQHLHCMKHCYSRLYDRRVSQNAGCPSDREFMLLGKGMCGSRCNTLADLDWGIVQVEEEEGPLDEGELPTKAEEAVEPVESVKPAVGLSSGTRISIEAGRSSRPSSTPASPKKAGSAPASPKTYRCGPTQLSRHSSLLLETL